jgi:hypothetical protein
VRWRLLCRPGQTGRLVGANLVAERRKLDLGMAHFASPKTAAALAIGILVVLFAYHRSPEQRKPANIEGYVYEKCVDYKLVGPVGEAAVSTSLDSTTATTDATGHFHLLTKSPIFFDEFYDVTVRADGVVINDSFGPGHPSSSIAFVLSPPDQIGVVGRNKSGQVFCQPFPPVRAGSHMLTRQQ